VPRYLKRHGIAANREDQACLLLKDLFPAIDFLCCQTCIRMSLNPVTGFDENRNTHDEGKQREKWILTLMHDLTAIPSAVFPSYNRLDPGTPAGHGHVNRVPAGSGDVHRRPAILNSGGRLFHDLPVPGGILFPAP
jgi:hypothetical protein